ncbi:MAG: class I SAM-dependent methyltransferase [Marinibacterium sp.]|nr:class I SAM-dependent methyltransferase [Marinibacterium sp.]
MDWAAFFQVHRGLDREGPGLPEDVHWAVARAGLSGAVRVCDAGCGPGADTETLAQTLPEADITGLEQVDHFVTEAQARVAGFGPRVRVRQGDMADPGGPYDLIWCAGALYFLGIGPGLSGWRQALAPGGVVAFSEPVRLREPMSEAAAMFWAEYPDLTDLDGIRARIAAAGYALLDHRLITGPAWDAYYAPLRARIADLRAQSPDAALTEALDLCETEADLWARAGDEIAYALMLVRPA